METIAPPRLWEPRQNQPNPSCHERGNKKSRPLRTLTRHSRMSPAQGRGPSGGVGGELRLYQDRLIVVQIFFQSILAGQRNGGAFGVSFEMFVVHERLADQTNVQI